MRVLKWPVPMDDKPHRIGGGWVALVAPQELYPTEVTAVMVWTIEADDDADVATPRQAKVYGTGQYVPETGPDGAYQSYPHLGSCVDGMYVWHVFVVDDDRWHEPPNRPKAVPA